ncbi:hypothetical protein ACIQCR_08435 [Streptomyces sp. NPDC093249]|uniref:hypothetical protein n=1 Tax=unclassified Streptomyces TaxID=2593676 RepID=UPI00344FCF31
MFEYEIHLMDHARLVREAESERLAHEAARTDARSPRRLGRRNSGGRVSTGGRGRFVRAA